MGCAFVKIDGKRQPAPRLFWVQSHGFDPGPDYRIEHIDRDRSNCRLINLRMVHRSQALHNRDTPHPRPRMLPADVVGCGGLWWGWFHDGQRWFSTPRFRCPMDAASAYYRLRCRVLGPHGADDAPPMFHPSNWHGLNTDLDPHSGEDCSALLEWEDRNPLGTPLDKTGFPTEVLEPQR